MERKHLNRILLTGFVMWALPHTATASTEADFLNILICMPSGDANANEHFVALMKRSRALNREELTRDKHARLKKQTFPARC